MVAGADSEAVVPKVTVYLLQVFFLYSASRIQGKKNDTTV